VNNHMPDIPAKPVTKCSSGRETVRFPEFTEPWRLRHFRDFLTESRIPGTHGKSAQKLTVKLYGKGVVAKQTKRQGSENTQYYKRLPGQFIYSKLDFLNGAFGIIPESLDGYESTLDLPAFDVDDSVDVQWFWYFCIRPDFYIKHFGLEPIPKPFGRM